MTIDFIKKCTANVNTNLSFLQILDEIPTNVSCTQVPFKRFFSEQCLLSVYENSHLRFLQSSLFVSSNNQCIINLGTVWHESFFFFKLFPFFYKCYQVCQLHHHLRRRGDPNSSQRNSHELQEQSLGKSAQGMCLDGEIYVQGIVTYLISPVERASGCSLERVRAKKENTVRSHPISRVRNSAVWLRFLGLFRVSESFVKPKPLA